MKKLIAFNLALLSLVPIIGLPITYIGLKLAWDNDTDFANHLYSVTAVAVMLQLSGLLLLKGVLT